ncbi:hypothetical protein E2542_SST26385 [Spatholobus suberectus]|nr:hypothetical protein E2542_SST26385 [Spatholobus suberectus]
MPTGSCVSSISTSPSSLCTVFNSSQLFFAFFVSSTFTLDSIADDLQPPPPQQENETADQCKKVHQRLRVLSIVLVAVTIFLFSLFYFIHDPGADGFTSGNDGGPTMFWFNPRSVDDIFLEFFGFLSPFGIGDMVPVLVHLAFPDLGRTFLLLLGVGLEKALAMCKEKCTH